MNTILFHMVLPPGGTHRPQELYFRGEDILNDCGSELKIPPDTAIRFDTYFNGFYYSKYLDYTVVDVITPALIFEGTAHVRVLCQTASGETLVLRDEVQNDEGHGIILPAISLTSLPPDGMLFLEISAMHEQVKWITGYFSTEAVPTLDAKVAIVICTYRREEYVLRNLEQLKQDFWLESAEQCNDIDVFVVDNGTSLPAMEHPHITVFPNKNYGGSGGFTRGILEAYRRRDQYTHVLLMDDDISFETESVYRTVQLLKFATLSDDPLCIGGQMLIEDKPTVQFESGGFFKGGYLKASNQNLDLGYVENLLENTREVHADYNAWWYCCFPLNVIDKIGFPLPLFIKTDDVEYGIRMKPKILLMNGIGVWHTAFSDKYSPHLEYYIKRNELIVSAIHRNGDGIWSSLYKLFRRAAKSILLGEPSAIYFLKRAYDDFLKGPEFLMNTDAEVLNQDLLEKKKQAGSPSRFLVTIRTPFLLCRIVMQYLFRYHAVAEIYRQDCEQITSESFWTNYLELNYDEMRRTKDEI